MLIRICYMILGLGLLGMPAAAQSQRWLTEGGRLRDAEPPYGLERVRGLLREEDSLQEIAAEMAKAERLKRKGKAGAGARTGTDATTGAKSVEDDEEDRIFTPWRYTALRESLYASLSVREQFTYTMINPEEYNQLCSTYGQDRDWATRLYARLASFRSMFSWSDRQRGFLRDNRDSVLALIREDVGRLGFVGLNEKTVIVDLHGVEMIPLLMETYKKEPADHDILTVLMLLMKDKDFTLFPKTPVCHQLYGKDNSYRSSIVLDEETQQTILGLALDYYALQANGEWNDVRTLAAWKKTGGIKARFADYVFHPAQYTQICSLIVPDEDADRRVYAYLIGRRLDEQTWSEEQLRFFHLHRDSVLSWLGEVLDARGRAGFLYKKLILELNGAMLMPALIATYRKTRDHDILTLLMGLMVRGRYAAFTESGIYQRLYGERAKGGYRRSVILDPATETEILRLAERFRLLQKDGFVRVPAGTYWVGKKGHALNPRRQVRVDSFYIAKYETTNREFAAFVEATGYVTVAERRHDALVFAPGLDEFRWIEDSTAYWRYPNGVSRGGIADKMDHPVTCICFLDILAYCKWANVRLPTLEEWEIAARAGSRTDWFFGADDAQIAKYANVWHGRDHLTADSSDGYMYTSPVGHFLPNLWGLYDVYGNVFEFCSGKLRADEPPTLAHARGGSWWCSAHACHYFNSCDIGRTDVHASFSNQGFRVARNHL